MFTKLDNRDIKMLESSAKNETSKVALQDYLSAHNKAEVAWKVFRDSLLLSEDDVSKVNVKSERKFKAGDKVRVLSTDSLLANTFLQEGDIATVMGYKGERDNFMSTETGGVSTKPVVVKSKANGGMYTSNPTGFFEESALELVVEEGKSPNELRAEVIQRAKEFIGKHQNIAVVKLKGKNRMVNIVYIVNAEKKAVVALVACALDDKVMVKGIAKCNPDDVFNEHIGKAIALGRALGKGVSEFENAIQPTEPIVGHVVKGNEVLGFYRRDRKFTLTSKQGDSFYYAEAKEYEPNEPDDFIFDDQIGKIIDDTNAQYISNTN